MKEGEISEVNEKAAPPLEEETRRDTVQEDKGKSTERGPCHECEMSEETGRSGPKRSIRFHDRIVGNFKHRLLFLLLAYVSVMVQGVTEEKPYFNSSSE